MGSGVTPPLLNLALDGGDQVHVTAALRPVPI